MTAQVSSRPRGLSCHQSTRYGCTYLCRNLHCSCSSHTQDDEQANDAGLSFQDEMRREMMERMDWLNHRSIIDRTVRWSITSMTVYGMAWSAEMRDTHSICAFKVANWEVRILIVSHPRKDTLIETEINNLTALLYNEINSDALKLEWKDFIV